MAPEDNNKTSSPAKSWRKTLAICAVLVVGGGALLLLIFSTEPIPQRESAVRETAMLVEVEAAEGGTFRPVIHATGVVKPAREILLRPRIDGEVVELSANFVPGGYVAEGGLLLRIDDTDYRIELDRRNSDLQRAEAELEIEHGRQDIAERDYRQLGKTLGPDNRALVLREPQLRSAEAGVRSAQTDVRRAQLDLERTRITAPFDAQVLSRHVNIGSQVSPGDTLARLVGVDTYWVETTLPLDRLQWLSFTDDSRDGGSAAAIRHRTAWPEDQTRSGRLHKLIGELEGDTRMARVLVTVDDPLARRPASAGQMPLVIGTFVECLLEGNPIEGAVRIRREHVRKGDTAWVMQDGQLQIRPLEIVFQDAEHAYVDNGLDAGDQVVTSSLATVKDGVRLRARNGPDG